MSGETERDPSAFTIDSLRIHLEQVIDERDRRYEQRFSAQEKAVNVANTANEKRFDSVNEFRGQLADRERLLMPRGETEALLKALADNHATQHSALAETLDGLAARLDRKEGQQFGSGQVIAWGFAAVAALAAVIGTVVVLANVLTAK